MEANGVELLSTGGTAKAMRDAGVKVMDVSEYTGAPEMMDGRVKTLHPMIHGGILGRRGIDEKVMAEHNIKPIDLVVVNLYPFVKTVSDPNCPLEKAIENIDIGGPTMVRAAAKNNRDVAIVVRASDYDRVIKEMDANDGSLTWNTRFDLAIAAFEHTAAYDSAIANYFGTKVPDYGISDGTVSTLPRTLNLNFKKLQSRTLIRKLLSTQISMHTMQVSQQLSSYRVKSFHTTTLLILMLLSNVFVSLKSLAA